MKVPYWHLISSAQSPHPHPCPAPLTQFLLPSPSLQWHPTVSHPTPPSKQAHTPLLLKSLNLRKKQFVFSTLFTYIPQPHSGEEILLIHECHSISKMMTVTEFLTWTRLSWGQGRLQTGKTVRMCITDPRILGY